MSPKVSIIIPVYKVEKYIRRCLNSVLKQTLTDFEVVLVDDGSPDNCGKICDEYAGYDSRVRVIHQRNAGVSSARNTGLDAATGEYIGFADSDDFIVPSMYEQLYREIVASDADVAMCDFFEVDNADVCLIEKGIDGSQTKTLTPEEAIKTTFDFSRNVQVSVWNKLYRRKTVQDLRFDTRKHMAEDLEYLMRALTRSRKVVYIPTALYGYFINRSGAATSQVDHEIEWYIESGQNIAAVMNEICNAIPEIYNPAMAYKCVNGDLTIANAMARNGKRNKELTNLIQKDIRAHKKEIFKSGLHITKIAQLMLFILNPGVYYSIMRRLTGK